MTAALRCVVSNGPSLTRAIRSRFAARHGRFALRLVAEAIRKILCDAECAALYGEFPQWRSLGRLPTMDDYRELLPVLRFLPKGPMP